MVYWTSMLQAQRDKEGYQVRKTIDQESASTKAFLDFEHTSPILCSGNGRRTSGLINHGDDDLQVRTDGPPLPSGL